MSVSESAPYDRRSRVSATLVASVIVYLAMAFFSERDLQASPSIKKPLVYLVPEGFLGPVFVFFGQKDGVDTIPDAMGNAVTIPKNGIVKLRGTVDNLLSKDRSIRNLYWISVSPNGQRKVMFVVNAVKKDSDGVWSYSYYDRTGKLQGTKGELPADVFFIFLLNCETKI